MSVPRFLNSEINLLLYALMDKRQNLANKLNKRLGPEFISYRPGWNGLKIAYIEGWKAISLANKLFGFDGWSSKIIQLTKEFEDFCDGKYSIGITCHIRVTLRSGVFHEDIGFGSAENQRSKAIAVEKANKEAATDALKRALRQFGNVLGNCCYDKNYIKCVGQIKSKKIIGMEENDLYREEDLENISYDNNDSDNITDISNLNSDENANLF